MNPPASPHSATMSLQGVTIELGGHTALSDVTFDVEAGTLMGVVGPNGGRQEHSIQCYCRPAPRSPWESNHAPRGPAKWSTGLCASARECQLAVSSVRAGRCNDGTVLQAGMVPAPRKERPRGRQGVPGPRRPMGLSFRPHDGAFGRTETEGCSSHGRLPRRQVCSS